MTTERASSPGDLLVQVSTALMVTSADAYSGAMRDALARVADFAGADRAAVLLGDAVAYRWSRPGVEPMPAHAGVAEGGVGAAWRDRLDAAEVVGVPDVAALP